MSGVDPGVYKAILRVRQAYAFDIGCLLMRFFPYMVNIGTVTMLTLSGYSFFIAGLVSSTSALATFLIVPRISKLVDTYGQSRIVPWAALAAMTGLALMLAIVLVRGPEWALFVAAVPMGCSPNPPALARTRWTFLIRSGKLGRRAPLLRTMFSYEGVLDDIGFMFSPAISIALASGIVPVAGMVFGGAMFVCGTILLMTSRGTEPVPGWDSAEGAAEDFAHRKSVFRTSGVVRVLFVLMLFVGAFYGVFDTATVSFAEEAGQPTIASVALMIGSFISMVVGFAFGMMKLSAPPYKQLAVFGAAIGIAYGSMMLIDSIPALFAVTAVAAVTYAPFLIVANAVCERAVPGDRLTEAITWINAGITCGMAIGPSACGTIVDTAGTVASFDFGGCVALAIPVTVVICYRLVKRELIAADRAHVVRPETGGEGE